MNRVSVMIFIIAFWLILPVVFQFTGIMQNDKMRQEFITFDNITKPTFFDYLSIGFKMLGYFFVTIVLWVDGLPLLYNIFLWFLKIVSGFIILLIIRGA